MSAVTLPKAIITTDGGCRPNPGPGGWAAIIRHGESVREICGSEPKTTNNRMELRAVIEALKTLNDPSIVIVRTDSRNTISWCAPDSFTDLEHQERYPEAYAMIVEYRAISKPHRIKFRWVKGHAGDRDNVRCDALAKSMIGAESVVPSTPPIYRPMVEEVPRSVQNGPSVPRVVDVTGTKSREEIAAEREWQSARSSYRNIPSAYGRGEEGKKQWKRCISAFRTC